MATTFRLCFLGLAAGALCLGGCGTETVDGTSRPVRASVSGTVVSNLTGAALQDVPVRIASTIVHTDQLGGFQFHRVTPGIHVMTVEAEGYEDYVQTLRVSAGENELGEIVMFDLPPDPPVF